MRCWPTFKSISKNWKIGYDPPFTWSKLASCAQNTSSCLSRVSRLQAATLPPHQPAAVDAPAFVRMQLEQFVNASEVDGLTPFHLAMINGIAPAVHMAMFYLGDDSLANVNLPRLPPENIIACITLCQSACLASMVVRTVMCPAATDT